MVQHCLSMFVCMLDVCLTLYLSLCRFSCLSFSIFLFYVSASVSVSVSASVSVSVSVSMSVSVSCVHPSSERKTKGERSKRQLWNSLRWPFYSINSVNKTKITLLLPPTQHHSFHRNLPPLFICLCICLFVVLSVYLSIYLSVCLSVRKFSIYLCFFLSF